MTTGGDEFEAERNQWDDGNNVVALEPGVVVAYERNEATNAKLAKAGIEVLAIAGQELGKRPRRRPLHDLPDRPRRLRGGRAMSTVIDLRGRHLMKLADYSPEEITYLIDLAAELKAAKREGREEQKLVGKEIALIFEKDSTRTRCAFEVAAYDQGAHVTFIGPGGSHMGHKETVKDTARVLGRMYDAIEYRGFAQDTAEELAQVGRRPDLQRAHRRVAPDPDPRRLPDLPRAPREAARTRSCSATSATRASTWPTRTWSAARSSGMDVRIASPKSLWPRDEIVVRSRTRSRPRPARQITITDDVAEAVRGADVLLTDVWVSMGEPDEVWKERIELLTPYQVNAETMAATGNPDVKFMHCLPAFHNTETAGRQGDLREVRDGGARGDRGGLRVAGVARLRRGREPDAHDQGRHGRHARRAEPCASSSHSAGTRCSAAASR